MLPIQLHDRKVAKIRKQLKGYLKTGNKKKIRFFHGSTNSTRVQDKTDNYLITISSLDQVISIDEKEKVALVEPNVPMDILVEECLKYNLLPKVVMEFPGITCGGGINGAALEASSYQYGQFNDTCIEYECVLGDGTKLKVNKNNNADLYYGITGTYGSLALITLIKISLIKASDYVAINFIITKTNHIVSDIQKILLSNTHQFVEGIVFNKNASVIITGDLTDMQEYPLITFSSDKDDWFYLYAEKSIGKEKPSHIVTPILDFLFRYNRGAFWMGKYAFELYHIPFNHRMRYFLDSLMHTRVMYKALHKTNAAQNFFIQDFYIPFSKAQSFLEFTSKEVGIYPLWLCPIKSTKLPQYMSPHYLKEDMLIDIGVWGNVGKSLDILEVNKLFEEHVQKIGGRKMLYAENFYMEEMFWQIYNKSEYDRLREKYKAAGIFPSVWDKTRVKKRYAINKYKGLIETIWELISGKFVINTSQS